MAEAQGDLGLADELRYAASQVLDPKLEIPYQATQDWLSRRYGQEKEDMVVLDELENLRKGLFNGDINTLDRLQGIIYESNGGRPVNVRRIIGDDGKPGVAIIRTTQSGTPQTERIMFDGSDGQFAGLARLNDYLQKINPIITIGGDDSANFRFK